MAGLCTLLALPGAGPAAGAPADVRRIAGPDRYATAAAVSAELYPPGVAVAYLATGAGFADALAAVPAAARAGGPVLLVEPSAVPAATAAELARLRPGRIVVLGGPEAVAPAVIEHLRGLGLGPVTTVAGADRYQTAAAVSAATFSSGAPAVFVASGTGFADAV
ncbi:MAG: cell wall-binding repeat-containing protein, partial [Acidimicrobiales bacterium]